jgi:hypothetical protein
VVLPRLRVDAFVRVRRCQARLTSQLPTAFIVPELRHRPRTETVGDGRRSFRHGERGRGRGGR